MLRNGKEAASRQNWSEAMAWYRRAAEKGSAEAEYEVGDLYAHGLGAPLNYTAAVQWYRKAADKGYLPAINNMDFMYRNGWGVPKDESKAREWNNKYYNELWSAPR